MGVGVDMVVGGKLCSLDTGYPPVGSNYTVVQLASFAWEGGRMGDGGGRLNNMEPMRHQVH